jgi:alkanesulfonate monooxygenase SsuD/methylene tetrahydromethanopterin reductase-like flavin-dependent oxidoreductase (luciferase family)
MTGLNVFAAETDAEGARLATSVQQQFIALRRGNPGPLKPPLDTLEGLWTAGERAGVKHALACTVAGSPQTVRRGLVEFIARTGVDELMLTSHIYDHAARLRSFEIVAGIREALAAEGGNVTASR